MSVLRFVLRRLEFFAFNHTAIIYWLCLSLLVLTALCSGMIGWWNWQLDNSGAAYLPRPPEDQNWQAIIETIQLSFKAIFASDLYVITPLAEMPVPLQIARIMGALAFILIVGRIFIFTVGGRVSRVFLWARNNHDVLLGEHSLANEYSNLALCPVTHIRMDLDHKGAIQRTENLNLDLKKAGAKRAKRLIVACETDVETWSEAQRVAKLYPNKEVLAHINDPWLLERVDKANPATRLKPFSFVSGVARNIMLAHPPYLLARASKYEVQHIIVVGFSFLGQALVREFLTTSISNNPSQMAITVIDPDARRQAAAFRARHPGIEKYVDFSFLAADLTLRSPKTEEFLTKRCRTIPPCGVYIALDETNHPLLTAVAIKDRAERENWFNAPIFVNSIDGSGLRALKQGTGLLGKDNQDQHNSYSFSNLISDLSLVPFGSWSAGMDGTALMAPDFDAVSRRFHETYLETMNRTKNIKDISHDWDYLEEELRVANRRLAAHMRATLDAAGFNLNTWLEEGEGTHPHNCFALPKGTKVIDLQNKTEIENLARLQHRRWMFDRLLNGWKYAPQRDNRARLHDCLKEYDELDEATKEHDRAMVRQIASIVESV